MEKKHTILIIDDTVLNLKIFGSLMEESGYNTVLIKSGRLAFEFLEKTKRIPDLILLDIVMPDMDGYEVIRKLKANESYSDIPVIFITAKSESTDVVKGFELGAVDYVTKPFNYTELDARVKTHIKVREYSEELKKQYEIIQAKNNQLKELLAELDAASKIDFLTSLYNRRYMHEKLNEEMSRFRRSGRHFSVLMIDIDKFKSINDTYGHDVGDLVLKNVGRVLSQSIRDIDVASRWGGEEFLILCLEMTHQDGSIIANRLRLAIEAMDNVYNEAKGYSLRATITVGVTTVSSADVTSDDVVKRADLALYQGKHTGRNKVVVL